MRMFEFLLHRLIASDGLLAYYNKYPKHLRRAATLSALAKAA